MSYRKGAASVLLALVIMVISVLSISSVLADGGQEDGVGQKNTGLWLTDVETAQQLTGTGLGFIADTGRWVYRPNGSSYLVWDPPQLPTVEESIQMTAKANLGLGPLPFCTDEYLAYLHSLEPNASEEGAYPPPPPDPDTGSICRAIPEQIASPSPEYHRQRIEAMAKRYSNIQPETSLDLHHAGYIYDKPNKVEGIMAYMGIVNPAIWSTEVVANRVLAGTFYGNNKRQWIETGWAEYYGVFRNYNQNAYVQVCDDNQTLCYWHNFSHICDMNEDQVDVELASGMFDNLWDARCYSSLYKKWVTIWHNKDLGDDDADWVEALFEVREKSNRIGTISMDTVHFKFVQLRAEHKYAWRRWSTNYSSHTHLVEDGGYGVTTNAKYYDFEVDD